MHASAGRPPVSITIRRGIRASGSDGSGVRRARGAHEPVQQDTTIGDGPMEGFSGGKLEDVPAARANPWMVS